MNNNVLPKWSDKNKFEKVLYVSSIVLSIIIVLAFLIDFYKNYQFLTYIIEPGLMFLFIIEFIMYYKYDKKARVLMIVCFFVVIISFIGFLIFK